MRTLASICCLWIVVLLGTEESSQLECYSSLEGHSVTCQHQYTHSIGISQPGQNDSMEATGQLNITYSKHHPDAKNLLTGRSFQHCLIFQYLDEAKPDETGCDEDFLCDNSLLLPHPDKVHLVQFKGSMTHLYCCTQDNCNGDDQLKAIQSKPPDLPCTKDDYDDPQMIVRKRLISKPHYQDVVVYSCDDTNVCSTRQLGVNQCKNVTSTAEETTEMCCCDSVTCSTTNSPSTASIIPSDLTSSSKTPPPLHVNPLGPMPPTTSPEHTKWRFVAGISGAMVLALLVFVLVFIVVKKYRAHKRGPVTYSYNQLTADLAEEKETEDENMIVA